MLVGAHSFICLPARSFVRLLTRCILTHSFETATDAAAATAAASTSID